MAIPLYLIGSKYPRPKSHKSIYVDGTADENFRENQDVELSHWIPNRSEERYKAGTSTEMCFRYLDQQGENYDLVINNHLDIDDILSAFVLTNPQISLHYRQEIEDSANIGDFFGFGLGKSMQIYQDLANWMIRFRRDGADLHEAYIECFQHVIAILQESVSRSNEARVAESVLNDGVRLIDEGRIHRTVLNTNLVQYVVPQSVAVGRETQFLDIPHFCQPISDSLIFWPNIRNKWDQEKVQLIGVETENGYSYELMYPGYVWADSAGLWRPQDLILPERMGELFVLNNEHLQSAVKDLNQKESGQGTWTLFSGLLPFGKKVNPRPFPVVLSFLDEHDQVGQSSLLPEKVGEILQRVEF